eukprot:48771_1
MSHTKMLFTACYVLIISISHAAEVDSAYWDGRDTTKPTILPNVCWLGDTGCQIIPGTHYGLKPWTDDLKIDPEGVGGWNDGSCPDNGVGDCIGYAFRTQSGATTIIPFYYLTQPYYYYHGDYSGAEKYAQGTVNAFDRYFQCPFEAHLQVKYSARFCGSETEDKIFLQVNGVALGEQKDLGCTGTTSSRGSRPGSYTPGSDSALTTSCPGGGYAAWSNCAYDQYMNVGELSFHETSKQWYPAYTPIQVQFFWRFSYQDDNIWIYNIELTCKPSARGVSRVHGSIPDDIKWIDTDGITASEWNGNPNWQIEYDSCQELVALLDPTSFSSGPNSNPNRPSTQYQPFEAKSTGTAWCGISDTIPVPPTNYLIIDLGSDQIITQIDTWGGGLGSSDWVTQYTVSYQTAAQEPGNVWDEELDLTGNTNADKVKKQTVSSVTAKKIRFKPTKAHNWPCMRVEAHTASRPLIATLNNNQFSNVPYGTGGYRASTQYEPQEAKKSTGTAWCGSSDTVSNSSTNYLQINLGSITQVGYVRTWGKAGTFDWTTKYILKYSTKETPTDSDWTPYNNSVEINGNKDATSQFTNKLGTGISAWNLRFIPTAAHTYPCLRVDAFPPPQQIPLVATRPPTSFDATPPGYRSGGTGDQYKPSQVRTTTTGEGWCGPSKDTFDTSITIDLGGVKNVRYIYTWGGGSTDWVEEFELHWSTTGTGAFEPIRSGPGPAREQSNLKTGNSDATTVNIIDFGKTESMQYIKIKPTQANNWPCMKIEAYEPWWDPLCLDDEEPKYFHDGHIVSFQGRFHWIGASLTNLMGSKNDGLIGKIDEVEARPKFDEEFTVVTQDGLTLNIEIENTGMIYLKLWTIPYAYYDNKGENSVFYTHESGLTGPPVGQTAFKGLDTMTECALDGIVYISRTGWHEAEPFTYASSDEHESITGLPFDYIWNTNINMLILDVLVAGIILILFIKYCTSCGSKNLSDYSKVKTVNYDDDTESDVV